jgi:hypothetical protein
VERQLGPINASLGREPDITIRFVDELPSSGTLTYVGRDDAAFTDDAFLVLRSRHKSRARVQIPLDRVGDACEIVSERGLLAVPLLIPIVNLTALRNGALPLHAAAFRHRGLGVVATGWSKGGKTEALLAFAARGAQYIGDEWIYLADGGRRLHGIPEPIRVWNWHLRQVPALRRRLGVGSRTRLAALASIERVDLATSGVGRGGGIRWLRRLMPIVERQLHVDVAPQRLLGTGQPDAGTRLDILFLMCSTESSQIRVQPIGGDEVAGRMAASLEYERLDLRGAYLKYLYAFPDRRNALIEEAPARQRALLAEILAAAPAFRVDHPYPFDFDELYDAMDRQCRDAADLRARSS